MTFEADAIVDRRRLKRRLSLWRAGAIVALAGLVAALVFALYGERLDGLRTDYVARVDVTGLILQNDALLERLERIGEDDGAKALLIRIDSPGGTVVGGESLYDAVRRVGERKPVVALMNGTAASAAYMVALASDRIYARRGTVTGSIGVMLQAPELTGLLEKLGVSVESIKSAPLKGVPSPIEPLTPEGRAAAQAMVDDMYRMFVDLVRERRLLPEDRLAALTDGRVFTGAQAVDNGLVDALGDERAARVWLAAERGVSAALPARDVRPEDRLGWLQATIDALTGKMLFSERLTLDGLIALWHPDLRS